MHHPTWVLGYHGCDEAVGEAVLNGEIALQSSDNDWDWLGSGIYFWENNAQRAWSWAVHLRDHPQGSAQAVTKPFVVGAIIDLGNCLDLLEAESIRFVKNAHEDSRRLFALTGLPLPANAGPAPDRGIRRLDCAVINYAHATRILRKQSPFHSVRAAFTEGHALYAGAGFQEQTHIQLCVRREKQILGYFRPRSRRFRPARTHR